LELGIVTTRRRSNGNEPLGYLFGRDHKGVVRRTSSSPDVAPRYPRCG
jgi:hypothetical protein